MGKVATLPGHREAVEAYLKKMRDAHTEEIKRDPTRAFWAQYNPRYTKIVEKSYGQDSVVCFIDPSNGDILKSATWNQPQKNGLRGNIYTEKLPLKGKDFYMDSPFQNRNRTKL